MWVLGLSSNTIPGGGVLAKKSDYREKEGRLQAHGRLRRELIRNTRWGADFSRRARMGMVSHGEILLPRTEVV